MAASNASFVVDTAGVVELETLRVMPGSDPRATEPRDVAPWRKS
jgi:hypothetical protein